MTIRPSKVQCFQGFPDAERGRAVSFHVPPLFRLQTVNIWEVIMEENQGYVIRQSVLFDNGRGFALGEHPRARKSIFKDKANSRRIEQAIKHNLRKGTLRI